MSRAFGEEVGRYFHEVLASHGIELVTGDELEAFLGEGRVQGDPDQERAGDRGGRGRGGGGGAPGHDARRARRAAGGQRDRLRLGARDLGGGDLRGRATRARTTASCTGGGCGSSTGTWRCSRGSTWRGGLLGEPEPYRVVPYFFSDLADWTSLEYVGPAERWDEIVWRGRPRRRRVQRLVPGRRAGGRRASVGRSEDLAHARRLIESGADVSAQKGRAGGRGQRSASLGSG